MARHDDDTNKFMDDVSESHYKPSSGQIARAAATIADSVGRKRPVSPLLIKQVARELTKQGGAGIWRLYGHLNENYKRDWYQWEPETIWQHLDQDGLNSSSEQIRNAVMALQLLVTTNQAFENWHVFEKVCHALNGDPVDFEYLQPAEPAETALAVKLMKEIRPEQAFDGEVLGYMAAVLHHAGICYAPAELFPAGVQTALDKFLYDIPLFKDVVAAWPAHVEGDTPLAIQLGKLHELKEYVESEAVSA